MSSNHGQTTVVTISPAELPLHCPRTKELWNLHPRVYLDIKKTGEIMCPYCGQNYVLSETTDNKD
ncbi:MULTISPECIES: zinc-finger domain-containing protein [Candidatus Ichthyocystis]|uniref:zinc-finger domain-containing protein n=1 Tax=Candidatus Ichthyocystis TaxID=2929841 RepID=UPI000B84FE9A|nr:MULTISPECIES: zinc-finger domain-containing protein [Ichthyocystis]